MPVRARLVSYRTIPARDDGLLTTVIG